MLGAVISTIAVVAMNWYGVSANGLVFRHFGAWDGGVAGSAANALTIATGIGAAALAILELGGRHPIDRSWKLLTIAAFGMQLITTRRAFLAPTSVQNQSPDSALGIGTGVHVEAGLWVAWAGLLCILLCSIATRRLRGFSNRT
jgi:hypothetical protein